MISKYLKLVKFSHSVFALPFALSGFFIAYKIQNLEFSKDTLLLLLLVILCMVFARNAAMGFNRWLDRNIDSQNPRTASREIPAGIINEKSALAFVIVNSVLFITVTFFINRLVFFLSPVALAVVLGYSYTKRFTWLCHIILGLGLALSPIGAYLAVTGKFNLLPILLSITVLLWTAGFDIIYALQDEEFDKDKNLQSIPAKMGKRNALRVSKILHFFAAGIVIALGFLYKNIFGTLYMAGSFVFVAGLVYQHILVKPEDISRVNLAFGITNGVVSLVFGAFTIASIFLV